MTSAIPRYRTIFLLLLFLLFSGFFCSSVKKTVKPNPCGENCELCPLCKGYGVIESVSAAPPIEGVELTEEQKKIFEAGEKATGGGWCLYSVLEFLKFDQTTFSESDAELEQKKREGIKSDPKNQAERSTVEKTVLCPLCDGVGWIVKTGEPDLKKEKEKIENSDYIDSLRKDNGKNGK